MSNDYYGVIGVNNDATQKEISKAFRAKARVLHPDKQPPGASEAAKQKAKKAFQDLARAYEVLSDAEKRKHYDLSCADSANSAGPSRGSGSADAPPRAQRQPRARAPSEEDEWARRRRKAAEAAERAAAEEQQRRREEEAERLRQEKLRRDALGSHWVKPPDLPKPTQERWAGWTQSGGLRTRDGGGEAERQREGKQRAAAETDSEKDSAKDDDSDASSVLSFNIGVYLDSLDLDDLEPMEAIDPEAEALGWGGGEVWRLAGSSTTGGQGDGQKGAEAAAGKPMPKTKKKKTQRPNCALQ
mmetsp:Transcript_43195/g.92171  ORF Transcript_43195/g.92171 Transcript_43195/m.92171 type:complete len:300 (-) Transcript_43195:14-913(-)